MLKFEENMAGPSFVTLGRSEFDMLCSKLNGLENSIADLRREISRNSIDHGGHQHTGTAPGGPSMNGTTPQHRPPTHTDVHGIHTKNDAVSRV